MTPQSNRKLPPVLISDIDGTIAFIAPDEVGGPTRLFNDFARSDEDIPNQKVVSLIKAWYSLTGDPKIYFVTNRDARWHDVTTRWLMRLFPPADYNWVLRMRPTNDPFSSAAGVKENHLVDEILPRYRVEQVWEDDNDCILMYKINELLVFDAKETW
jgi:hypothetical protein